MNARTRLQILLVALLMPLAPCVLSIETAPDQRAPVSYPKDPATVVFLYDVKPGELADTKPEPLLRIYGDGRVRLHYPAYS